MGPLIEEVHNFKDSMCTEYSRLHTDYSKLEGIITNQQHTINKLETTITTQQRDITKELNSKIDANTDRIHAYIAENKQLRKENVELKEWLTRIELTQLGNNVIISSMQEQSWESYDTTKECVIDTIVAAMGGNDKEVARIEAKKIDIMCCSHTGRYQLGKPWSISVTFQRKEDKQ